MRKKKRQRRNGNSHDDAMSLDSQMPPAPPPHSFPMTAIPPPPHHANPPPPPPSGRSYWLAWWKPSSNNNADAFDARPAPPPSYDAAMMHSVTDTRRTTGRGGEFDYDYEAAEGDGDEDDDSVSGNSQAPPYSEIHLDPIIPDWVNQVTTTTTQPISLPPQQATDASFAASAGLPETAARDRHFTVPRAGAALVLPARPPDFSALGGGRLRRPRSQMESRRQVENLGDGRGRGHRHSSGRRPVHSTLPSGVLMNLNARSREGIVVPPSLPSQSQERDAALQRFSLQLQLNISDSSDSSNSAFEGVAETAAAQVEESPASSSITSSENQ